MHASHPRRTRILHLTFKIRLLLLDQEYSLDEADGKLVVGAGLIAEALLNQLKDATHTR